MRKYAIYDVTKDELDILGKVYGYNIKTISNGKLKTIPKESQKKYKPRVLKELFEWKENNYVRALCKTTSIYN